MMCVEDTAPFDSLFRCNHHVRWSISACETSDPPPRRRPSHLNLMFFFRCAYIFRLFVNVECFGAGIISYYVFLVNCLCWVSFNLMNSLQFAVLSFLLLVQSSLVNTLPITKKNKHTVVTEAPKKVHVLLSRQQIYSRRPIQAPAVDFPAKGSLEISLLDLAMVSLKSNKRKIEID